MVVLAFVGRMPLARGRGAARICQPRPGATNRDLAARMPPVYAFHGDYQAGLDIANYLAVVGPETVWPGATALSSRDVTDGTSCTILIVENAGANVRWLEPRDLLFAQMSFELNDPAGVSSKYADPAVVMLDCSVRRLAKGLTPATLRALLTANGGEKIQEEAGGWILLSDGRKREVRVP